MKQITPDAVAHAVARQFTLDAMAPGLAQFRNYKRSFLRGDIIGGLTVAGLLDEIGRENIYATLPTAVAAYRNR